MSARYLNGIVPRMGGLPMIRADEVWVKVAGRQVYLFASMDDDTRYWIALEMADTKFQHDADNLLRMTKRQIGKNPTHFVTEGLPAYARSSRRIFGRDTNHMADAGIRSTRISKTTGKRIAATCHPTDNKWKTIIQNASLNRIRE